MKDILILLLALTGCMETEIPEVNPEVVSKSVEHSVTIVNDAANTTLHIEGCNLADMDAVVLEHGDTVTLSKLIEPKDTIILDGELWSGEFLIYGGPMYIPFSRMVRLYGGCNWKDSLGNRILHPISFDAEVNDWKRQENVRP